MRWTALVILVAAVNGARKSLEPEPNSPMTLRFGGSLDDDYEIINNGIIDGEPIFIFDRDSFDIAPSYSEDMNSGSGFSPITESTTTTDASFMPTYYYVDCTFDPEEETKKKDQSIPRPPNRRVSEIQCEYNMWRYKYHVLERERRSCEGASGIINGKNVTQGDFPHMGALGWITDKKDYDFRCGCSLISNRFALSAAHCGKEQFSADSTESKYPVIARFGDVYIKPGKDRFVLYTDIQIEKLIRHPNYVSTRKYYDIMLIRFSKDVPISHNVRPACLFTEEPTIAMGRLNATGWGKTEKVEHSGVLLYAELNLADRAMCAEAVKPFMPTKFWEGLKSHQFCAASSNGKHDTCGGDSGGPLQIQKPLPSSVDDSGLMYYVVGVTSFGIACGGTLPGLYTKVSYPEFLCWIEKNVWPDENNYHCP